MDVTILIPLFNEDESLPELHQWLKKVLNEQGLSHEIIFLDDGSKDKSWSVIETITASDSNAKGVRFRRNYGKSAVLNEGFSLAKGNVVITMDADLQDSPDEIPGLYSMIMTDGFDLVSGWKQKRYDPITKTLPTKLFNWATRKMSGISLHDFNCGLKAYKNEVVKNVEVYGEMHRYIPVIAKWNGFGNIGEKAVAHQARKYGKSKFGLNRFVNGFLDLLTIFFMSRFGKKPMHFFGVFGILSFILGFMIAVYLGAHKLYCIYNKVNATLITENPFFYLGLVAMIIGTQLFLAGFLGEMISRNGADRNQYLIAERKGFEE